MEKIKRIFLSNRPYLTGVLLFFGAGLIFLLCWSKGDGFLLLNPYHGPFLDFFFSYFTYLGDGVFSILIVLAFLAFRRYGSALQVLVAYAISGLLVQLLKALIITPRPKDFFALKNQIHLLDGITLSGSASFPSGHSASAFALATSLALLAHKKPKTWIYLVLAIGVGYSRIYLSNHFPRDVYAGAFVGFTVAFLVYMWMVGRLPGIINQENKEMDRDRTPQKGSGGNSRSQAAFYKALKTGAHDST